MRSAGGQLAEAYLESLDLFILTEVHAAGVQAVRRVRGDARRCDCLHQLPRSREELQEAERRGRHDSGGDIICALKRMRGRPRRADMWEGLTRGCAQAGGGAPHIRRPRSTSIVVIALALARALALALFAALALALGALALTLGAPCWSRAAGQPRPMRRSSGSWGDASSSSSRCRCPYVRAHSGRRWTRTRWG